MIIPGIVKSRVMSLGWDILKIKKGRKWVRKRKKNKTKINHYRKTKREQEDEGDKKYKGIKEEKGVNLYACGYWHPISIFVKRFYFHRIMFKGGGSE